MDGYIKKIDVLSKIEEKRMSIDSAVNHNYAQAVSDIYDMVSQMPDSDVTESVHGYWKPDYEYDDLGICSVCNSTGGKDENFCSYCGAIMDVKESNKNGE